MNPSLNESEDFDEEDECQHQWVYIEDWYGDPTIPNGTADCSFWRCEECGMETHDDPY